MNPTYLPSWNASINELKSFSRVKLIVSDIDGTLLSTSSKVEHEKFIRLVRDLKNKGIRMTFATGRTYSGVRSLMQEIPISSTCPMILYNGSVALYPLSREMIFCNALDLDSLNQLVSLVEDVNSTIFLYYISSDLTSGKNQNISEYVFAMGNRKKNLNEPNGQNILWNTKVPHSAVCVAAMIDITGDYNSAAMLQREILRLPTISATRSSNNFLEIRPQHSNKGKAALKICDELDIGIDTVMAIGDNDNDEEMFECAGLSVAVNNASFCAMEKAKYLSRYDSLTGVIEALELVRQSRRYSEMLREEECYE